MKRFDHFIYGIISGIILPPVTFCVFSFFSFDKADPLLILKSYFQRHLLTHVISLSVIINLLLFFIFINNDSYHAAKGVIVATLIYFLVVLILKFI